MRQQRRQRAHGVERAARAGDGPMRDVRSSPVHRQAGREQIEDADVAVQIERALDLRQIVGAHQRLLVDEQQRDPATPAK